MTCYPADVYIILCIIKLFDFYQMIVLLSYFVMMMMMMMQ